MRPMFLVSLCMFCIGIGCVAATVAQQFVVPPAIAGSNPQKWEQICVHASDVQVDDFKAKSWNPVLKEMGEQGWKLIWAGTSGRINSFFAHACFQRPLP